MSCPSVCLQPLVENAVRHGVGKRASLGTVTVHARCEGRHLLIEVADNGPGLPEGQDQPSLGVGLSIVKQSLRHLYGDEARMDLETRPEQGFTVRLWIPRPADNEQEA